LLDELHRIAGTPGRAVRCDCMALLGRLACYLTVVGGLSYALTFGAIWLARPDPSFRAEAHVAPIPPRIAESLARKQQPIPVAEPVSLPAAEPVEAKASVPLPPARPEELAGPAMTGANVSLNSVPLPPPRRAAVHAKYGTGRTQTPSEPEALSRDEAPRPAPARVSTARTDFPY
jgi:hypothetical protein